MIQYFLKLQFHRADTPSCGTESDWFYNSRRIHDFDMDGDIDDNYDGGGATYDYGEINSWDGASNCEGAAIFPGSTQPIPSTDPLESYIHAKDWLEEVIDEGLCSGPLSNRGTWYDWHRFWWDMYTDQDVPIEDLVDIYVDVCPTNWEENKLDSGLRDDWLPIERLETSCDHHGYGDEWLQERSNGQDH
jgi:hypothetical protein